MRDIDDYQQRYLEDFGFEMELVRARQVVISEWLNDLRPVSVVEVGCGNDLLLTSPFDFPFVDQWVVVEPSMGFAGAARDKYSADSRVSVIQGFAEDCFDAVLALIPSGAEAVICSGVLHEVADSIQFLSAVRSFLKPGGRMHINVPNAFSMHRQLARLLGLISHEYEASSRNIALQQNRVFCHASLKRDIESAELIIVNFGGYFVKPFTHAQMHSVCQFLPENICHGLFELGRKYPEIAAEIFVDVAHAPVDSPRVRA